MLSYTTVLAQYLPPLLTPLGTFWVLGELRTGGGAYEQAKIPAGTSDNQSSVPRTHTVAGENLLLQVSSSFFMNIIAHMSFSQITVIFFFFKSSNYNPQLAALYLKVAMSAFIKWQSPMLGC